MNKSVVKRTISIFLAAFCVLTAGCAGIYDKEYVVVNDYVPPQQDKASEEDTVTVINYAALKRALRNLVSDGKKSGIIIFPVEYDGDLTKDMSSACWDVRTQDALCAYCVENISYDISRIVAYDEASIFISYADTGIPFTDIQKLQYSLEIEGAVNKAISVRDDKIALLVDYSLYSANELESFLSNVYRSNPMVSPKEPVYSVNVFSGTNRQRLYEININYGMSLQELSDKQEKLEAVELPDIQEDDVYKRCISVVSFLADKCQYDASADSSVYSALVENISDSNGISLAFVSLCNKYGIDCQQISGQYNRQEHYWNIVTIDGKSYHIDISSMCGNGTDAGSFKSDDSMWGTYRWDLESYPNCNETISFAEFQSETVESEEDNSNR